MRERDELAADECHLLMSFGHADFGLYELHLLAMLPTCLGSPYNTVPTPQGVLCDQGG